MNCANDFEQAETEDEFGSRGTIATTPMAPLIVGPSLRSPDNQNIINTSTPGEGLDLFSERPNLVVTAAQSEIPKDMIQKVGNDSFKVMTRCVSQPVRRDVDV